MNQYPLWKYLLILAALLAGLIYTLPNLYGESPAVQVSPLRSNLKADAALQERVESILKAANLDPELVYAGRQQRQGPFCQYRQPAEGQGCAGGAAGRRLCGRAQPVAALAAVADRHACAADVSRPGLARRGAFPAAGGHECRADQVAGFGHRRHTQRAARQGYPVYRAWTATAICWW